MIEWNKINKFCKWSYEDYLGTQRCEKRQSHPCDYDKCPLRKEPPKTLKKIFKIEYHEDTLFTVKEIREILNHAYINDPFVKVEEIPNLKEIKEIDLKHVSIDGGCGFTYKTEEPEKDGKDDDMQATGDYPDMYDLAAKMLKESEKPEIDKGCENCGWNKDHVCVRATKNCDDNYSEWKPIEKTEKK